MGGVQSYYYLHDHPSEISNCDIIRGEYVSYDVIASENGINEIGFTDQLSGTDSLGVTTHYGTGEVDIDILRNAEVLGYRMYCVIEHELAHAVGYDHTDSIFQNYRLETCVCHYNEVGYCDRVQ